MPVKDAFQKDSNPKWLTVNFVIKEWSFTRGKIHNSQTCITYTDGQGITNFH